MRLAQLSQRFPAVVGLFTSQAGFYRVLHYQVVQNRRATLDRHSADGTGVGVEYTVEHMRLIAVRRLINKGLGCKLGDAADDAILAATWDEDTMTATVVVSGAVAVTVLIPDAIWREIAPVPEVIEA